MRTVDVTRRTLPAAVAATRTLQRLRAAPDQRRGGEQHRAALQAAQRARFEPAREATELRR
jgi:hypothetical protein